MQIQIHPLQSLHATEAFTCGSEALESWLRQTAKQHVRKGISRTYVATEERAPTRILGFYSLTVSEAETHSLPARMAKALPRKIPIVVLGRLAVSQADQGRGIGGLLLIDALHRTVRVATEVGIAAVVVDAKDQSAVAFYRHYGFQPLPDQPHRLVLPIQTAIGLFEK